MKAEIEEIPKPAFKPVRIALTFETQAELDAVGSMFNSSFVVGAMYDLLGVQPEDGIYKKFKEAGANIHYASDLTKLIAKGR